jgi:NADH:ubiquinone oxidoreductase subunit B-like Fe-S oxidoreductase
MRPLSDSELSAIVAGLQMRCCFIETGTATLRAVDVQRGHQGEVRALSTDQMRLIIMHEDLIREILAEGIVHK